MYWVRYWLLSEPSQRAGWRSNRGYMVVALLALVLNLLALVAEIVLIVRNS